jgi:DNA-binding beta-propeller fold protein YncE
LLQKQYAGKINTAPLPLALEKDKQPPSILQFPSKIASAPADPALFDGKPVLFVADSGHQRIAVMTLDGVIIDSIGSGKSGHDDGEFNKASFNTPQGLAYKDHKLYIADTNNHLLRVADLAARTVTTLAGTGTQGNERNVIHKPALEASLSSPWDITFYPDDTHLVMAMAGLHQLWSYDLEAKTVSVIAGNGNESIEDGHLPQNALAQTSGLSTVGGKLYFVDAETSSLRVYADGNVTTLIGSGLFDFGYKEGAKGTALMQHPLGVFATDKAIYVADSYNHSLRSFDLKTGNLSDFAGDGKRGKADGAAAEFNEPNALLQVGGVLYVADTNNHAIRALNLTTHTVSTLAVKEQPRVVAEFSEQLPNTEDTVPAVVATGANIVISLELQKGWHINDEAPSTLALFDNSAAHKLVTAFDRDTIKARKLALPKMVAGDYRLQGTLYYCEDKEGAQCLLKSFDVQVSAKAEGQKAIGLKLN